MDEPSLRNPPEKPLDDRLDSWKEIAAHLNRDVTTVQRWEKREGMPVHRHQHDRMGSVYASRAELDAWTRTRNLPAVPANGNSVPALSSTTPPQATPIPAAPTRKFLVPLAAALVALAMAAGVWIQRVEYFWRSPIANARFQSVTDFDGVERDAAVSRDGHLVAFLSDRDGPLDVWVTQVGSGQFHNLTRGTQKDILNREIRSPAFSPDGSFVTFWKREETSTNGQGISVWSASTLGGQPQPYLNGVVEFEWSRDGSKLVYHTPGPGDPMFVSDGQPK